jgi:hypothetical protein
MRTPLCEFMDHYGSDKGPRLIGITAHSYTSVYHSLFQSFSTEKMNVFELGLGTNNVRLPSNMGANGKPGASLRAWRDYFPNATVFGADIDRDVLFNEDRIVTMYCDQTNPQVIQSMWKELPDMKIIVEDGLHMFEANVTFFENSIHKLLPGGFYIIEDIYVTNVNRFRDIIESWRTKYPNLTFELVCLPIPTNVGDNNLLIVRS